jgi:ribosomal 30S subunit maturation factor RimM
VVAREGAKPFYVPFVMDEFILKIDIAKKEITIKVMPGLL